MRLATYTPIQLACDNMGLPHPPDDVDTARIVNYSLTKPSAEFRGEMMVELTDGGFCAAVNGPMRESTKTLHYELVEGVWIRVYAGSPAPGERWICNVYGSECIVKLRIELKFLMNLGPLLGPACMSKWMATDDSGQRVVLYGPNLIRRCANEL